MRLAYKCLLLFCFSAIYSSSFSQGDTLTSCGECRCSDDASPAGIMISHVHEKSQWMVSYRFMRMNMSSMLVGSDKVSNDYIFQRYLMSSDAMHMNMHMLMAMYGLSDRITLMGMANYNTSSMDMAMLPSSAHHHHGTTSESGSDDMRIKSSGFGDIKLNVLYGLLSSPQHNLVVSAGLNIPIGSIQERGAPASMYSDQRLPYSMQMGSGTWDLLPSVTYLYNKDKITYSAQMASIIRPNYNKVGYRLGNELTLNNWVAYQCSRAFSSSLRAEANAIDAIKGRDTQLYAGYEPSANPKNYGGRRLTGYLGTNFYFRNGFMEGQKLGIEAGIPIYQYLNGPQIRSGLTIFASWSITF